MQTPNRVKMLAQRAGFEVSPLQSTGTSSHYVLTTTKTAAPLEVYFRRESADSAWLWAGAIHRVHWSDPIAKFNGGQPELTTFTAWRAYMSLLSVMLK
jgi:hypothetical protein